MRFPALLCFIVFSSVLTATEDKEKPVPTGISYYNFLELIRKADRILVGEIGEKDGRAVTVKAIETLKGPAKDSQKVTPDAIKRAEELLNGGTSSIPPQGRNDQPENVSVAVIPPAENMLPAAGTQVIFFLWDQEKQAEGKPPTYRINHPQCIYEANVLPQVRVALQKPRSIADGRFLRERDLRLAERAATRKVDEELRKVAGGETVLGLQIEARRPQLMLKGDNSFQVSTNLINRFGREISVYDGPAAAYGVVLCAKDAAPETALVLRLNGFEAIDPMTLNITSLTDFDTIDAEKTLAKDHKFDATKYTALKGLDGEYTLKMFYSSGKDGLKDGLAMAAWTGTVVSKPIEIRFKSVK